MPDSFDERFSGLPVDAPTAPLISDIVGNAQIASPQFNLVPVDYDPFPKRRKGPAAWNDEPPSEMIRPDAPVADKAFGLNGKERYQFFPERLARSVYDIMSGQVAPYNPSTGEYNVESAMDVAGLLGGAPLGIKPGTASLGSGAVRPIMNANKNEAVPAFYSAVEKAITDISQPKMTGQQWLGTLSNKPGVKPEELDWIGLKDYLKENADKVVTKQEIESHVVANKVELKEVNKADIKDPLVKYLQESYGPATKHIQTPKDIEDARKFNSAFRESTKGLSNEEVLAAARKSEEYEKVGDTKFGRHDLVLPGGENYREKLLTLPEKSKEKLEPPGNFSSFAKKQGYTKEQIDESFNKDNDPVFDAWVKARDNYEESVKPNPNVYKSSHWDEHNVLAHVRMNDRTMPTDTFYKVEGLPDKEFATRQEAYQARDDAGLAGKSNVIEANKKKSLHIEEIQSDWHQQGRQKGYKEANLNPGNYGDFARSKGYTNEQVQSTFHDFKDPVYREWQDKQDAYETSLRSVPDAPFKKTWHELALKRMLREAAEKGYDRLSWTPGEAQAARYDLSKQVQDIGWNKASVSDHSIVRINPIDGKTIALQIDKSGKIVESHPRSQVGQFEGKNLSDVVGKELAEKILNKETGELKNTDLKIGGEGMKGFYDQIIPKALEKIGKEHGVKVKQARIGIPHKNGVQGQDLNVHYINIPQSLKDQAMHKSFPLFSGGFMLNPIDHDPFSKEKK